MLLQLTGPGHAPAEPSHFAFGDLFSNANIEAYSAIRARSALVEKIPAPRRRKS
jgi:hypothetical protein